MYTVTMAARISQGSVDSEFWNAAAVPWKLALNAGGHADLLLRLLDGLRSPRPAKLPAPD